MARRQWGAIVTTSDQSLHAHAVAARAFAERVNEFTRVLNDRRSRWHRDHPSGIRPTKIEAPPTEELLEGALEEVRDQYEELLVADEELRVQMDVLQESAVRLQRERERYVELFECTPLACILTDRAGVVQAANRAGLALLGADDWKLRGRSILSFVVPTDAPRLREVMQRGAPAEREADAGFRMRIERRRGAPFDGVLTIAAVERGTRFLVTLRPVDASPRSLTGTDDATLARTLRDKEELLARERALRAELEKTDRAKDRFIAILSHDLRGPINSVLGWTQLLRREQLPKEGRERALETIERSSRAQLELVEELLDLSRISADKMVLEVVPIDFAITVRRLVESFVPVANDAGVTLEAHVTSAPTTVFADRKRIAQIVSNLVSNAIKFTPSGGRIDVRIRTEGAFVLLEVQDSGQGMKREALAHLFECYRQNCAAATARAGLGLGLYIVKQLAQLHGGTVEAISEGERMGSTVTVRLPLRESAPAPSSEHVLPEESSTDLDGMRILVVEDEPDARDLLTTVLSGRGANVSAASDARQALAMFDSCSPDVVVSDIEMPGEDGCSLIRRLRDRAADVRAMAVSGFAAPKDAERALDAGFDVHVSKPIEPRELVTRIRALSSRPRRP